MDYLVTIAAVVEASTEKAARQYVDRKLRGSYTVDFSIIKVEYKNGKP